jgi:hypothetical protein
MDRRTFLKQAGLFGLAVAASGLGCTPAPGTLVPASDSASGADLARLVAYSDLSMGTILLLPYKAQGDHWVPCEGQVLPIAGNHALYALLGSRFGGDGQTTFALPDLRQAAPGPGVAYHILTYGMFPHPD